MTRKGIIWASLTAVAVAVVIGVAVGLRPFLYWQNETLEVTHYTIRSEKLPRSFDGYKIVLLADIQGKVFDGDNAPLYEAIEAQNADMLCIAGDLVDEGVAGSREVVTNLLRTCKLPEQVYAVTGNHDVWSEGFDEFIQELEDTYPITFLENESVRIEKDGETITLSGISDPNTWDDAEAMEYVAAADKQIEKGEAYHILMFHRANMLDYFNDKEYDLVLSGHMHGGQVRLPFVGGLKSPHGDWFPKYSGGRYDAADKTYIVSRGIGNAVRVPRLFNRPELVVITLQCV